MISDFFFPSLSFSRYHLWPPFLSPPLGGPRSIVRAHLSTGMVAGASRALYQREGAAISVTAPSSLRRYVCARTPVLLSSHAFTRLEGTCLVVAFRVNQPRSHANLLRPLSSLQPPPPPIHGQPRYRHGYTPCSLAGQPSIFLFYFYFYSHRSLPFLSLSPGFSDQSSRRPVQIAYRREGARHFLTPCCALTKYKCHESDS